MEGSIFSILDLDTFDEVISSIDDDAIFATSLTCKAFHAQRKTIRPLRTNVHGLSTKRSTLLWAVRMGCPITHVQCNAALDALKHAQEAAKSIEPDASNQIARVITAFLRHSASQVRMASLSALIELNESAINTHADAITDMILDKDWEVRLHAANTMNLLHDSALNRINTTLGTMLRGCTWYVRTFAMVALCELHPTKLALIADGIAELLLDPDACVRHEAVGALGHLYPESLEKHADAIARLLKETAMRSRDRTVTIINTLLKLRPAALAKYSLSISETLTDADEFVQYAAVCALRTIDAQGGATISDDKKRD